MKNITLFSLTLLILTISPSTLLAKETGFLGLSVGYYNILDGNNESISFRAEYRPAKSIIFKQLKPWLSVQTTLNASLWGGAGLLWEFKPTPQIFITPSLGIGLYRHGRGDVDLSHPLQLRSQIEFAYSLKDKTRIALAFSHMSNAGLSHKNPGTEELSLYYYMPIDTVF